MLQWRAMSEDREFNRPDVRDGRERDVSITQHYNTQHNSHYCCSCYDYLSYSYSYYFYCCCFSDRYY